MTSGARRATYRQTGTGGDTRADVGSGAESEVFIRVKPLGYSGVWRLAFCFIVGGTIRVPVGGFLQFWQHAGSSVQNADAVVEPLDESERHLVGGNAAVAKLLAELKAKKTGMAQSR